MRTLSAQEVLQRGAFPSPLVPNNEEHKSPGRRLSFERNGQVRAVEVEAEEKQHILTNPRLGAPTEGWCGV